MGLWKASSRSTKLKTSTELCGLRRQGSQALAQKPGGRGLAEVQAESLSPNPPPSLPWLSPWPNSACSAEEKGLPPWWRASLGLSYSTQCTQGQMHVLTRGSQTREATQGSENPEDRRKTRYSTFNFHFMASVLSGLLPAPKDRGVLRGTHRETRAGHLLQGPVLSNSAHSGPSLQGQDPGWGCSWQQDWKWR